MKFCIFMTEMQFQHLFSEDFLSNTSLPTSWIRNSSANNVLLTL